MTDIPAPEAPQVTTDFLKKWSACADGFRWFKGQFPTGTASYPEVMEALRQAIRHGDMMWLANQAYEAWLSKPGFVRTETDATDRMVMNLTTTKMPSANIKTEDAAQIGSSGNAARIEAAGENAVVAIAGTAATVTLGPNGCAAIAWHDGMRTRFATLYVGEGGIEAGVAYRVRDGEIVRAGE